MKKISVIKNKNHTTYMKKRFVWIKMMKIIKIKERLKTTAKKECDNGKTIAYKLRFIDGFRFMPTSLS